MRVRQTAAHLVLAFLLVLSQQLGMAHAVSHLSSGSPLSATNAEQDKRLPADLQCDQCLAFAAIGSAVHTPPHVLFVGAALGQDVLAAPVAKLLPSAVCAFDSRAPPVVL